MDVTKLRIGTCRVTYKGRDMGHTLGGIELTIEREFTDMTVDKYGTTPVDKALTGQRLLAKMKLAQPDFYSIDAALPESSSTDAASDRVNIGSDAGFQLRAEAGQLVLHPTKNGDDNLSEDIVIYKAVSTDNVTLPYKVDEQRGVEITWEALVDESYDAGRRLGHIGPATVS